MSENELVKKLQKRMDWENEQADKGIEPFASSRKKLRREMAKWNRFFKYNILVPPQVYDFLVSINTPFKPQEITNLVEKKERVYRVYTRKTKGKKIYNPSFYLDKDHFQAVKLLAERNGSSVAVDSKYIHFNAKKQELNIYGLVTYIKKDSDRFKLCEYMFGRKNSPRDWELVDLVEALEDRDFSTDKGELKKLFDWVNGKIRELNADIKKSIGFDEFISYESGKFVVNPINTPLFK